MSSQRATSSPTTRSAGKRCKIDRFPILNVSECDVHSDPKHGQEGLLVQKLGNISGRGHFKEKQASLASQKLMVDDGGGDFQASFPDIFCLFALRFYGPINPMGSC